MTPFKTLQIPEVQRYWIRQARVPICFLPGGPKTVLDPDGATLVDILVDNHLITAIEPAGTTAPTDLPAIDLESRHVWPTLIDMHAHLDKGHIVTRSENPDGSFAGALQSTADDRARHWTAEDTKRRMEFGLRCAYVHGVAAIRTHLDSAEPGLARRSWAVFREARAEWADRILVQAVRLGAHRRVPHALRRGTRRSRRRLGGHSRRRDVSQMYDIAVRRQANGLGEALPSRPRPKRQARDDSGEPSAAPPGEPPGRMCARHRPKTRPRMHPGSIFRRRCQPDLGSTASRDGPLSEQPHQATEWSSPRTLSSITPPLQDITSDEPEHMVTVLTIQRTGQPRTP